VFHHTKTSATVGAAVAFKLRRSGPYSSLLALCRFAFLAALLCDVQRFGQVVLRSGTEGSLLLGKGRFTHQ
jgi:hypothetical protein